MRAGGVRDGGTRDVGSGAVAPRGRRVSTLVALCTLLIPIPAHRLAAQGSDSASAAQEIRARRAQSNDAIAHHDTAGIAAHFAPNVIVVASTSSQSIGRAANVLAFAEIFQSRPDVTYRRTPDAVDVFLPWRMASERGRWVGSWSEADGKVTIGGSYFAKWRNLAGGWKIESETFVPDRCEGAAYCGRVP